MASVTFRSSGRLHGHTPRASLPRIVSTCAQRLRVLVESWWLEDQIAVLDHRIEHAEARLLWATKFAHHGAIDAATDEVCRLRLERGRLVKRQWVLGGMR